MDLPKLEACGNFVREVRTPENMAGFIVAEIPLYAQFSARSDVAAEVARRCNEYNELKARVAKLENLVSQHDARTNRCVKCNLRLFNARLD